MMCGLSYMNELQQWQGEEPPDPQGVATKMHACCVVPLARMFNTVLRGCALQAYISGSNAALFCLNIFGTVRCVR